MADILVPGLFIIANVAILCFAIFVKRQEHRRERSETGRDAAETR
ncbi:hypothetical protein [Roseovarius confluentis]